MNQSERGREVSRPKRRLYALLDEPVDPVASYDDDVEWAGGEGDDQRGA